MSRILAFVALAVAAVAAAVVLIGDDGGQRTVRAEFDDAAGLRPGSVVRVNGATVGQIRDLRVTDRDTAEVTLEIDEEAWPGAGASAAIRAQNLLGEKFVDLEIGDRARPLPAARIPLDRTSTPVEIDDVLDVLDPATRDRLGLLMAETGVALGNRGRDLSAILQRLPPTLDDAGELLEQLGQDTVVLERLLAEADRVADTVARERGALGRLVRTGADAFAAPASRRAGLAATLREAPGTLAQLRRSLRRLDSAGAALRPASRGLRETAPALTSVLRALPGFETAARPALATLEDVSPSLARLGREGAPVVRRLRSTARSLSDVAQDADALTRTLDEGAGRDLLSLMQNWALAIQTRDGVGHVFRVALALTPDVLRNLKAYVEDPPARRRARGKPKRKVQRPERPAARPARPAPPKLPDEVTELLDETLDEATKPVAPALDAVEKALGGLLGGRSAPREDDRPREPLLDLLLGP